MKFFTYVVMLIALGAFTGTAFGEAAWSHDPIVDDGTTTNTTTTVNEYTVVELSETRYMELENLINNQSAAAAAIANIPAISHDGVAHGHNGVGVAVGVSGNSTAFAVGYMHNLENFSFMLNIAQPTDGGEAIVGGGGTISW